MANTISIQRTGAVAIVTLNRTQKRNAMTLAMWKDLAGLFRGLAAEREVRTIILTGGETCFSAGADIGEFDAVRGTPELARSYEDAVDGCCDAIASAPQVTMAVVHGPCMGGGCSLALACDFRLAHADAFFAIPAARLSIVYGVSSIRRLLALTGLSFTRQFLFGALRINAEEALQRGLADQVSEDPTSRALAMAAELGQSAPITVGATKEILDALVQGRQTADDIAARHFRTATLSDDYAEARVAFGQHRKPVFRGT